MHAWLLTVDQHQYLKYACLHCHLSVTASESMWDAELLLMQETGTAALARSLQAVNALSM